MMKFKLLNESMNVDDFDLIGKAFNDHTFRTVTDSLETDNDSELLDWVWDKCSKGNFVETQNVVTGEHHKYRPIEFSENAVDTEDLLIEMYLDDEEIPQLEEGDYYTIIDRVREALQQDYDGVSVDDMEYTVDGDYGETYRKEIPDDELFDEIDYWFDGEIDDALITKIAEFIINTVVKSGDCDSMEDKSYYYAMNDCMGFNEELSGDELENPEAPDASNTDSEANDTNSGKTDTNSDENDADIMIDDEDNVIVLDEANSHQYKKAQQKELARQRQALINQIKNTQTKFKELSTKLNSLGIDNIQTSNTDSDEPSDNSTQDADRSNYKSEKDLNNNSAKKILTAKNWFDVYKKSGNDFKRMQDDLEMYSPEEQEYIKRYITLLNDSPEERLNYERAVRNVSRAPQRDRRGSAESIGRKINAVSNGFRYGLSKGGIHII